MSRSALSVAVCGILHALCANAQYTEDVWRDLIVKAADAADAKNYAGAEETYVRALHEAERFGAADQRVATTLNDLGQIYRKEKKFAEAEASFKRAYMIMAEIYGDEGRDTAESNVNMAGVLFDENRQSMAIPYLRKALTSYQTTAGGEDVNVARVLCMLGDAYRLEKDFRAAEEPLHRCADIREKDGGMQNADLAEAVHSLALTYEGEGKLSLAEPRFRLAEKIRESTLGITSPLLAQTMEDHAALLRQMGREKEAARLELLAGAIRRNQKSGGK